MHKKFSQGATAQYEAVLDVVNTEFDRATGYDRCDPQKPCETCEVWYRVIIAIENLGVVEKVDS